MIRIREGSSQQIVHVSFLWCLTYTSAGVGMSMYKRKQSVRGWIGWLVFFFRLCHLMLAPPRRIERSSMRGRQSFFVSSGRVVRGDGTSV